MQLGLRPPGEPMTPAAEHQQQGEPLAHATGPPTIYAPSISPTTERFGSSLASPVVVDTADPVAQHVLQDSQPLPSFGANTTKDLPKQFNISNDDIPNFGGPRPNMIKCSTCLGHHAVATRPHIRCRKRWQLNSSGDQGRANKPIHLPLR